MNMNLTNAPTHLLREALELRERLDAINNALMNGQTTVAVTSEVATGVKKRGRKLGTKLSPAHRKALADAQRARWAKTNEKKTEVKPAKQSKMSPAARAKIAAAMRASWAKRNAAKAGK